MDRNLTIRLDEALLARAHALAARRGTTLTEIIRRTLEGLTANGLGDEHAMNGNQLCLFAYSMGQMSREEARRQLGVDDHALALLLREAGFPPPRASEADEAAMLHAARDVRLRKSQ
jgi:ribbon-helix-helix CopG family protein